ncbi:MAG: hypothetical protein WAO76_11695 [Georgfuchsia sp.]
MSGSHRETPLSEWGVVGNPADATSLGGETLTCKDEVTSLSADIGILAHRALELTLPL